MLRNMCFSWSIPWKHALHVTVLAVPDSPQNRAGFFNCITWLTNQAYLTVSTVGTRIDENFLSAGIWKAGTFSSHLMNFKFSMLKKLSYREEDGKIN